MRRQVLIPVWKGGSASQGLDPAEEMGPLGWGWGVLTALCPPSGSYLLSTLIPSCCSSSSFLPLPGAQESGWAGLLAHLRTWGAGQGSRETPAHQGLGPVTIIQSKWAVQKCTVGFCGSLVDFFSFFFFLRFA